MTWRMVTGRETRWVVWWCDGISQTAFAMAEKGGGFCHFASQLGNELRRC